MYLPILNTQQYLVLHCVSQGQECLHTHVYTQLHYVAASTTPALA